MEYRTLGSTSLKVSVIGLGYTIVGNNQNDYKKDYSRFLRAWELGINFFDTAEGYGQGQGEVVLGKTKS